MQFDTLDHTSDRGADLDVRDSSGRGRAGFDLQGVGLPLSSILPLTASDAAINSLDRILHAVRTHLEMDVAFVSEFVGGRRVFKHLDLANADSPIKVGDSDHLEEGYCQRVVDGRLPELIPDTSCLAEAMALPVTEALPVGSHLSIPIRLRDGSVYGTFCSFSHIANPTLNERDLKIMRAFAELATYQIQHRLDLEASTNDKVLRIRTVVEERQFAIVFQPIYSLNKKQVVGYECLSRFSGLPYRSPDVWFAEAFEVDLGVDLELAAIRMALENLPSFSAQVYLTLNVSFKTIADPRFISTMNELPGDRLVLEITEHDSISDYAEVSRVLRPLRRSGLRVAVDDAGAGYSSFRHILQIKPDFIKLDRSLIQGIDTDADCRALAEALVGFALATGSEVVAEGVETASELEVVRLLRVDHAQGFYLGKPMSLVDCLEDAVVPRSA